MVIVEFELQGLNYKFIQRVNKSHSVDLGVIPTCEEGNKRLANPEFYEFAFMVAKTEWMRKVKMFPAKCWLFSFVKEDEIVPAWTSDINNSNYMDYINSGYEVAGVNGPMLENDACKFITACPMEVTRI